MKINRPQLWGAFTHTEVFIEEGFQRSENTEYPPDFELVAFDLPLVKLGVWCVCPRLESQLDFACDPEVASDDQRAVIGLIDTPFQFPESHPHGLA